MGVSNADLSKIALAQGYHGDSIGKGVCHGATALAGQAVLLRKVDEYNQRLDAIHATYIERKSPINSLQQKIDFSAFFQSLAIHNVPKPYLSQLPSNFRLINQDIETTMSLMASVELEEKGGISKRIDFSGIYPHREDVRNYLHSLNNAILAHSTTEGGPIEFFCSIAVPSTQIQFGHALMLGYSSDTNNVTPYGSWYFYDTNGIVISHDTQNKVYKIVSINAGNPQALEQLEEWLSNANFYGSSIQATRTEFYSLTLCSEALKKISNDFLRSLNNNETNRIEQRVKTEKDFYKLYGELCFAALYGRLDLVNMLLQKKGVDARDEEGHKRLVNAFMNAAGEGHIDIATLLLKQNVQIDEKEDLSEIADFLLKQGIQIDNKKNGRTALMYSACNGQLAMATFLIEKDANINAVSNEGCTTLMFAAENGHLDMVQFLIGRGADIKALLNNGYNALMLAAENGHVAVVQYLLERGADLKAVSTDGYTALHLAVKNGHVDTVQLFFEKRISTNRLLLQQLFRLAAKHGQIEILKYLLLPFANQETIYLMLSNINKSDLLAAAQEVQPEINEAVLEKMDFSALYELCLSALKQHPLFPITSMMDRNFFVFYILSEEVKSAIQTPTVEIVDSILLLLQNYCDISVELYNKLLMELIVSAIDNKNSDLVIHLLEENAKHKANLMDEDTVMMFATKTISSIKHDSLSIEQWALKKSCNYFLFALQEFFGNNDKFKKISQETVRNHILPGFGLMGFIFFTVHERRTALMDAAGRGDLMAVKDFIVNRGAKVNAVTINGYTPLMFAAEYGHLEVVKFLIESGADINKVSRPEGHTALSFAYKGRHADVANFLKVTAEKMNTDSCRATKTSRW